MKANVHFRSYLAQFFLGWGEKNSEKKNCKETRNLCSITIFENRAVDEKMWGSTVEQGRPQMTIWGLRIACWIPKATNTHKHTPQST